MNATLILGILQLLLQEANRLSDGTPAHPYTIIGLALEDTITKVAAQVKADANEPIDLDSLKPEEPIE